MNPAPPVTRTVFPVDDSDPRLNCWKAAREFNTPRADSSVFSADDWAKGISLPYSDAMADDDQLGSRLATVTKTLLDAGDEVAHSEQNVRVQGYKKAARGMLELKALNRQLSAALDSRRRVLEQHKERVDSLHLQLENLLYKKAYLLREIRECRAFTTPALKAVESETSNKIASLQYSSDLSRQHQQAIEFLETEMNMREQVVAALEEKKQLYSKRETELDGRRKILDELPGRITRVEAAVSSELSPIFDVV